MRRTTITRRTSDAGGASVRRGDTELGTLGLLAALEDGALGASFAHRPAFADHAEIFQSLARADGDEEARISAEIEAAGIHVWHGQHEMRIDVAGTLSIAKGQARFKPTDAFNMIRSGGHG